MLEIHEKERHTAQNKHKIHQPIPLAHTLPTKTPISLVQSSGRLAMACYIVTVIHKILNAPLLSPDERINHHLTFFNNPG